MYKRNIVDGQCDNDIAMPTNPHHFSPFPSTTHPFTPKTAKKHPPQPCKHLQPSKSTYKQQGQQQPIPKQEQNQAKHYKIILLMYQHCQALSQPVFQRKFSDSPLTDHSDPPNKTAIILPLCLDLRLHLYQGSDVGLNERLMRRGVSWLQTVGWSRGMGQACIWNAVLLFYAYRSKFLLRKEEMETIILVCLQLSSKIYESRHLQTTDLLMLASRPISRDDLRLNQEKILRMVEFNLVVPHYLACIHDLLDPQTANKAFFLCELLALKDHRIYFCKQKIERIIRMVEDSNWSELQDQEGEEIKQLLSGKQSRILHHKYGSKFDVDLFVELLKAS